MDLISKLGYSRFSPYQNSPFLDIKSPNGLIDMSNTDVPLVGIGLQTGRKKLLRPRSGIHSFPGDKDIREIKLNLPQFQNEDDRRFKFNPYMFAENPQPGINIHGLGAETYLNILNNKKNKLGLTGNIETVSVGYPGGVQLFGKPQFSGGLRFTHTFRDGGESYLLKAQDGKNIIKGKDFIDQWMKSPMYKSMLEASAQGPELERIRQGRITSFNVPSVVTLADLSDKNEYGSTTHRVRTMLNATVDERNEIMNVLQNAILNPKNKELQRKAENIMKPAITGWDINIDKSLKPGTVDYESVLAHEYGHTSGIPFISKNPEEMSKKELNEALALKNSGFYIPQLDVEKMRNYQKNKQLDKFGNYISNPEETRQFLNQTRYLGKQQGIYDPYTEKITPEQFKKIDQGVTLPIDSLRNLYNDDQIIEMLNSISKRNNESFITAKIGGSISTKKKKLGGSTTTETTKNPIFPIYKDLTDFQSRNGSKGFMREGNSDYITYECLPGEQCTTRANKGIDLLLPGTTYFDNSENTKKLLGATLSINRAPTEEEIKKYPYFKGDVNVASLDAWDIPIVAKSKDPNLLVFYSEDDKDKSFISFGEYIARYKNSTPIGSFISLGRPGHIAHTVRVAGFLESGEPLVADYGEITPLSKAMYIRGDRDQKAIGAITKIPGKEKFTFDYFKKSRDLSETENTKPYITNLNKLPLIDEKGNVKTIEASDEFKKFHNSLVSNKNYISGLLGMDPSTYDRYAKIAITLSGKETEYGEGSVYNMLDWLGSSKGLTQLKMENIEEKYPKILQKYKKGTPEHNALATILYLKELDKYKDNWYAHGSKAQERPYFLEDEQTVKNVIRNIQGKKQQGFINSDFLGRNKFVVDNINLELPYQSPFQSENSYRDEVNNFFKNSGYNNIRFDYNEGRPVIYKQTAGNKIGNTIEDAAFYGWQSPNTIYYGDAGGQSRYYLDSKKLYNLLFPNKLFGGTLNKKLGGSITTLKNFAPGGLTNDCPPGKFPRTYQKGMLTVTECVTLEEMNSVIRDENVRGILNQDKEKKLLDEGKRQAIQQKTLQGRGDIRVNNNIRSENQLLNSRSSSSNTGQGTISMPSEAPSTLDRALDIISHPTEAFSYLVQGRDLPTRMSGSNPYDFVFGFPGQVITSGKNVASSLFSPIQTAKTLGAAGTNLLTNLTVGENLFDESYNNKALGLGLDVANVLGAKVLGKNALRLYDKNFTKVGQALNQIEREGIEQGLSKWEIAKRQMENVGITSNQRRAYTPILSNFVYKNIYPYGYGSALEGQRTKLGELINNIRNGGIDYNHVHKGRNDAWRLYLGKPQINNTFRMAETSPFGHRSYSPSTLRNIDIYSISDPFTHMNLEPNITNIVQNGNPKLIKKELDMFTRNISYDVEPNIMGGYNKRLNNYGLEYNDIWDLNPTITPYNFLPEPLQKGVDVVFGKKYKTGWGKNAYYYEPKTFTLDMGKFLGKPFMSHELIPEYTRQGLANEMRQALNAQLSNYKKASQTMPFLKIKLDEYQGYLDKLEGSLNK